MTNVWLRHLVRLYLPVYQYESDTLKIMYAGYSSVKRNYYVRFLLQGDYQRTFIGMRWFWKIPDLIKSYNIDFVISEISRISLNNFHYYKGYILPVWSKLIINIDRPMDEICPSRMSHFAHIKRRIRKYKLTYEVLTDKESFNYFIEKFYIPYITQRHGEEAVISDLNLVWKSSPFPFLLAIKEDEAIVAASLNEKSGEFLKLINLGLLDGNEEYLRHGVIGALYYYGILEGQKMGCRYFDAGGTRPFLNDGLTKYKIGWGAEFVSDYSPTGEYVWFGVNERSPGAQEFISNNPFMYFNKDHKLIRNGI
jgi:hypothetical protein